MALVALALAAREALAMEDFLIKAFFFATIVTFFSTMMISNEFERPTYYKKPTYGLHQKHVEHCD